MWQSAIALAVPIGTAVVAQTSDVDIWQALERGGIIGVLVVVLLGGIRKWWVFGWQYSDLERERDMYRDIALKGTETAERGAKVVEQITSTRIEDMAKLVERARKEGLIE